jgi:hypothetical protein
MMRIGKLDRSGRLGAPGALNRRGTHGRHGPRRALTWLAWLVAAAGLLAACPPAAEAAPRARSGDDDGPGVPRDRDRDRDRDRGRGREAGDRDADDREPDADAGTDAPPPPAARPVGGPPVGEVLAQAYRTAGLARSPARGLARRARLAGLLPSLTVRAGRNTRWQDAEPDVDRGVAVEARASWRLDRLLFDGRELQIASAETARRRERRQLASRVIRAYYHWQRTAAAAAGQPRWASRAEEAAAELDALTDGWFTRQLTRARRDPPTKAR